MCHEATSFALWRLVEHLGEAHPADWCGSGQATLANRCDSPAEVDRVYAELVALSSGSQLEPFDAFWGQRYATVLDPDEIRVDLYAALVPDS